MKPRPHFRILAVMSITAISCFAMSATADAATRKQRGAPRRPPKSAPAPAGSTATGFTVTCDFSHTASDDPIVHAGMAGMSHNHTFFGATTTSSNSTPASIIAGGTTCKDAQDHSAYWIPTLLRNGTAVAARGVRVGYSGGVGVIAPPAGLKIVAGGTSHAGFACVSNTTDARQVGITTTPAFPSSCEAGSHLVGQIVFPNCWDATNLDSIDHKAHMAYDSGGKCPTGFATKVAQLTFNIDWPISNMADLALSSGEGSSLHADFMNGWIGDSLARRLSKQQPVK